MNVNPLSDVVLIRRLPPEEMSAGGIALAHDPDFKEDIGIVEFVGAGKLYGCKKCKTEHRRPPDVKVGDKVLISKYGGTEVKLDEEKYMLVREDDILGVIA